MILWCDLETFSDVPLKSGTHRYAERAEIMLFGWALDEGEPQVWDWTAGERMPDELADAWRNPAVKIVFHNSFFDRTVMSYCWKDWLHVAPLTRWHDTMVQAMVHSLPGSLDKLSTVLGLPQDLAKNKDGKRLINLFCKPRPAKQKLRRATSETHPQDWELFKAYLRNDITAMREVYKRLPMWNYKGSELELWHFDQKVNDRGVAIDLDLARAALRIADRCQAELADRTQEITEGEVESATQRDALLGYILEYYDITLPDMKASTLESLLREASWLPAEVVELLNIRLRASLTSIAKYATLLRATSSDGRLRGLLQFAGALRTTRWAGRTFQPQNLSRVPKYVAKQYDFAIDTILNDSTDLIFDNPMEVLGSCIRGAIVAPEGRKLVVADLSNIEGRMLAWLAGEEWKLKAFRDFDNGIGHDLYKIAYGKSFGVDPGSIGDSSDERQVGKVQELAFGYEGGMGAWVTFAAGYSIDLIDMGEKMYATLPPEVAREARDFYLWCEKKGKTFGLDEQTFVTCDSFKRLWRQAHPATVTFWRDLETQARRAINNPGVTLTCRRLRIRRDGAWLRIVLPSGRALCYPHPRVGEGDKISYMGVNQYSRQWQRLHTYGGKLAENVTQAAARDILASSMIPAEEAGYQVVLSVHDELITETPDTDAYNVGQLSSLMASTPAWADGLPLAAAGFETHRYRK